MSVYLLKILTPEKRIYEAQVVSVTLSGTDGGLTVLAGHAPMAAILTEGPIIIRPGQEIIEGVTGRGMLWVDRNETVVMVHAFRWDGDEMEMLPVEEDSAEDVMF